MDEIDLEGLDEIDEEELADILRYPPNVRVTMKEHIDTPLAQLSVNSNYIERNSPGTGGLPRCSTPNFGSVERRSL